MKRATFASICLSCFLFTGCAGFEPTPVTLHNTMTLEEGLAWQDATGNNSIRGSALLRTSEGKVASCAGFKVTLIPATAYSTERIQHTFGSVENGFRGLYAEDFAFSPDPQGYYSSWRTASCDAEGIFWFENLPEGTYYLTSFIEWTEKAKSSKEFDKRYGGTLMQRVKLQGDKRHRVVLADTITSSW